MRLKFRYFLSGFSLFFLFSCQMNEKVTYDSVLEGGNVINLIDGSVTIQDLFIKDGRIAKMESGTSSENYTASNIIDASGKYILPGFWDNHVHFRGGDSLIEANKRFLGLFVANGITTVRDAGGDLTNAVMSWKDDMENGDLVGPTIFTSGPK
ncbi:hypothetical protein NYZ99_11205 [Maribacter litopenaei]|uniref:Amidohydrolase family protein n=1 Tax=Maribacter litopenaei TaxID=2976127 RepID=A0ABY5Y6W4_9FLAO|nr:hypothetical protein [Maribacter litopenaei]UWX53716.1 hypothetical protein NYZ99_11205 [Maribacter litopenaei]